MTRRDEGLDAYEHRPDIRLRGPAGLTNPPVSIERCTCGGDIVVVRRVVEELRAAIATHNATPEHRAWRHREARNHA